MIDAVRAIDSATINDKNAASKISAVSFAITAIEQKVMSGLASDSTAQAEQHKNLNASKTNVTAAVYLTAVAPINTSHE